MNRRWISGQGSRRSGIERLHVNADFEGVRSTPQNQAAKRAYVAVVPAPCERYVTVRGHNVVRWVDVKPADSGTISGYPCMRRIRTYQSRLALRWIGSKVSTYVTGGEI